MIDQPSHQDDVGAWMKYAGRLRQRIGELKSTEAVGIWQARAMLAERRALKFERLAGVWQQRAQTCQGRYESLAVAADSLRWRKRRDESVLNQLETLLDEGDIPAAVDLLAQRRAGITAHDARLREAEVEG